MEHTFLDKYSDLDGFLQRLDPRIKMITFFIFIVFILNVPQERTGELCVYFFLLVFLILLSRVPVLYILKRSLVILPLILLLSFFNFIYKKFGIGVLMFKSWLALLVLILLSSTTKFSLLLKGMEKLYFPKILITLSSFMYRYLFVLTDEAMRMQRAWHIRYFGKNKFRQISILGNVVGTLFIHTYERAERVYQAMCVRGFSGEIITLDRLKIGKRDIGFSILFLGILLYLKLSN